MDETRPLDIDELGGIVERLEDVVGDPAVVLVGGLAGLVSVEQLAHRLGRVLTTGVTARRSVGSGR